ncbi:MAG: carboxypeptidase-like regulatory domain-containing protein [Bacteroidales bacterium]
MKSCDVWLPAKISGIAFLVLMFCSSRLYGQVNILDSLFTIRAGTVKTGNALGFISRQTGYYFTYDSRLINPNRKVNLSFQRTQLRDILKYIINNDSIDFSVINKYIIISRLSPSNPDIIIEPDWEVKDISGTITDFESEEPIPFATIGIPSEGKGTVANNNGEFLLKINRGWIRDTLVISHIGYVQRKIPVWQAIDNEFNIRMKREYISIPEIIIRNQAPQEILRKAFSSIKVNYGNTPAILTAFYREAVLKKNDLQNYSEAILEIYKSSYASSLGNDQMKIIKSRKTENIGLKDTLTVRLKAGLNSCLALDGAKNTFDFLLPENFSQYDYRMTDIVKVDEGTAFAIEFIQKPDIDIPLFMGTIYINTLNYAVEYAEFELNPVYIKKNREDFITYQGKGYSVIPISIRYTVSYKNINGRYFLNHVRGDLNFTARQKNRFFTTNFLVFFEMAVTDISTEKVTRFDRDEIAPLHSVFSRTILSYDPEFWGDFDFLKPEANLLQELKNMNARLQVFTKHDKE